MRNGSLIFVEIPCMSQSETNELLQRITYDPGIFGGKAIIRGMRFTVSDILDLLASGMSSAEIIEDFPFLEEADIKAALLYASVRLSQTRVIHAAA